MLEGIWDSIWRLAITKDSKHIICGSENGLVIVYDLETSEKHINELTVRPWIRIVCVSK